MMKQQFRDELKRVGLSVADFAQLIGKTEKTVYDFGNRLPVPIYARVILRLVDERGGLSGFSVGVEVQRAA